MTVNLLFYFKQKTAYEMRIREWSSDGCSSDLLPGVKIDDGWPLLLPVYLTDGPAGKGIGKQTEKATAARGKRAPEKARSRNRQLYKATVHHRRKGEARRVRPTLMIVLHGVDATGIGITFFAQIGIRPRRARSEENTSDLQPLMRTSYAVSCLK